MGIATVHQFGGTFPLMSIGRCFFVGVEPTKKWGPLKVYDRGDGQRDRGEGDPELRHHPHRRRRPAGRRPVGRRAPVARHRPGGPFRCPRADPRRADRRPWRQAGVARAAHRPGGEAAWPRGDLHHPPGHARDGGRRPLRGADPWRRRRRLPQGREDPRGDHRPDGRRRGHGRAWRPRSKATWRPTRAHPPPLSST